MTDQHSWLPQPLPDSSHAPTGLSSGLGEPRGVPYDQPFGVGQPPPTFNARRVPVSHAYSTRADTRLGGSKFGGAEPEANVKLSVLEAIGLTAQKFWQHSLEWVFFTVTFGLLSFGFAWVLLAGVADDPELYGMGFGLVFLFEFGALLIAAMAMQAALQMVGGSQVGFFGFLRIVNPISTLILALGFGVLTAGVVYFLAGGEYLAVILTFFAFVALAGAIDHQDGPLTAVRRSFACFAAAPGQMIKFLVGTIIAVTAFGFFPVLGGAFAKAVFALMIAFMFRKMHGHHPA